MDWQKAWSGIKTYFSGVIDGIKSIVTGVKNHFKTQFESIKNIAKGAWTSIKTTFSSIGSWFKERVDKVKKFFSDAWSGIKTGASTAWSKVKSTFSSIGSWFKEKTSKVKETFSGLWSKMKSGAKGAWSSIKDVFGNVKSWFKEKFTDAWTAVKDVFSSGGKIFDGIKDGIADAFKKIVNKLIDGINTVVAKPFEKINDMLKKVKDFEIFGNKPFSGLSTISIPKIPKLAQGGYAAANSPQLAIIGDNKREGEIVAPESKITEAVVAAFRQFLPLFSNNGNNKPIYLTLKLGDGTFWEGFVDYHNDIVKRTGDTPLLV